MSSNLSRIRNLPDGANVVLKISRDDLWAFLREVEKEHAEEVKYLEDRIKALEGKEMYTINDAAAFFGVKRPTVYAMIERGDLAYVTVGKRRYIRREDIAECVQKKSRKRRRPSPDMPDGGDYDNDPYYQYID